MNINTHLIIKFPECCNTSYGWEIDTSKWYRLVFDRFDEYDPTYPLVYRITDLSGNSVEWFEGENDGEVTLTMDYKYYEQSDDNDADQLEEPEVRTLIYPDVKGLINGTI